MATTTLSEVEARETSFALNSELQKSINNQLLKIQQKEEIALSKKKKQQ